MRIDDLIDDFDAGKSMMLGFAYEDEINGVFDFAIGEAVVDVIGIGEEGYNVASLLQAHV